MTSFSSRFGFDNADAEGAIASISRFVEPQAIISSLQNPFVFASWNRWINTGDVCS